MPIEILDKKKNNVQRINKILDEGLKNNSQIAWDVTISKYVDKMEKIRILRKDDALKELVPIAIDEKIDTFIEQCQNPEVHIAFVGVVKAGKSTLINAFFGRELASTAVTPETAALTKFRAGNGKNYIRLRFYTSKEWKTLWEDIMDRTNSDFMKEYRELNADSVKKEWLNKEDFYEEFDSEKDMREEIKKWTTSKSATHYFVKEVEVGIKDFNLPNQVVLVDTPGLNDPVRYRSELTRQYIDRANAVVLCAQAKVLSTADLETIYKVFAKCRFNPEKVFIVGSQLDLLNDPEDDWKEQKAQWVRYLEGKECYGSKILAGDNIIAVSAHFYNLCLNFDTLTDREKRTFRSIAMKMGFDSFDENDIDKAMRISNIPIFNKALSDKIIAKHHKILLQDLGELYKEAKSEIQESFRLIKETQLEALNIALNKQGSAEENRLKLKGRLRELEQDREEISSAISTLREETDKRTKQLYEKIKSKKIGG